MNPRILRDLITPDVVTVFQKMRGERVPERVATAGLMNSRPPDRLFHRFLQSRLRKMMSPRELVALAHLSQHTMPGVRRLLISMDKSIFERNLAKAIEVVLPFSRQYLTNPLPSSCRYLIFPNQSYDGNPLGGDEQVFPEERLPKGKYLGPFDAAQVVRHLWRDGKVPEWVNVTVYSYDEQHTYLELLCCGRFTAKEDYLYHQAEGYPPFHVLGPDLPPDWESVEESGKFDLYWHGRKPKGIS